MTVQAINPTVTPKSENKNNNMVKAIGVGLTSGVAAGTAGYFLLPDKITAEKVLNLSQDEFKKTFKNAPKNMADLIDELNNFRNPYIFDLKAKKEFEELINELKELKISELLTAATSKKEGTIEDLKKILTETGEKTASLRNTYIEARKKINFETYGKATNHEIMYMVQQAKDAFFENILEKLQDKVLVTAIENGKDNKIQIEAFAPELKKSFNEGKKECVKELIDLFGESAPKLKSLKKAGVIGGITAIVIGATTAIFSGYKKTGEQAQAKV